MAQTNSQSFSGQTPLEIPLAEKMRPTTLDEVLGQKQLIGEGASLRLLLSQGQCPSIVLWGPPGCGKTTIAKIIESQVKKRYVALSAVSAGIKDVKAVIESALVQRNLDGENTLLFIDEIHRFNKAQQDALLQAVEEGIITLIGATTENPSFEVNNALLSRCQLLLLHPLSEEELIELAQKALHGIQGLHRNDLQVDEAVYKSIAHLSQGDARYLLNQVEWLAGSLAKGAHLTSDVLESLSNQKPLRYDKGGEEHYNLISVFQKSIRGSDVQAALYWMHRMLASGEEPRYILRRLMRIASEDIGLADPQAIVQATAAREAFDFLGFPEGILALDQLCIYLATAPKSNKVELAYFAAEDLVKKYGQLAVPKAFRNSVNKTTKNLGYGLGYQYDHDQANSYSGQDHLPKDLQGAIIYQPGEFGFEKDIQKRIDWWESLKSQKGQS